MKIIPPDFDEYIRKDSKFYFIYHIVHIPTQKYYIGSHSTYNIFDKYYGSPSLNNKFYTILQESKQNSYTDLIFTIIKWSTRFKKLHDEELVLQKCKNDTNCLNINFKPTQCNFTYKKGDPNNPFRSEKIRGRVRNRNLRSAAIYHFYHPKYGDFIMSIGSLIQEFKNKGIILDRGIMGLIAKSGSYLVPIHYKRSKNIQNKNKYLDWKCLKVIKTNTLKIEKI